jgi:hypothetical protein
MNGRPCFFRAILLAVTYSVGGQGPGASWFLWWGVSRWVCCGAALAEQTRYVLYMPGSGLSIAAAQLLSSPHNCTDPRIR